jgi:hypothetical protein
LTPPADDLSSPVLPESKKSGPTRVMMTETETGTAVAMVAGPMASISIRF